MSTVDGGRWEWYNSGKEMVYIMKKWLCLLLVLFLLPAAAMADSPVDPVLVPITPETLPQGQYCHLGGSLILVQTGGEDPPRIYDLDTGESIVVTPREEDRELWVELWVEHYVEIWAAEGMIFPEEYIEQVRSWPLEDLANYCAANGFPVWPCSIGTEYAALNENFLLNRLTGVITIIPEGLSADKFTAWNTFLSTNEEQTLFMQYDLNGQPLHNYQVQDILPLRSGALALLGLSDNEKQQTHYQCILLDQALNVRKTLDIGHHHNRLLSINQAYHSSSAGRLLLNTYGKAYANKIKVKEKGRLRVLEEPVGPYLDGLLVIDTATSEVHRIAEDMYVSIIGMASDGSYALFCSDISDDQQVYKLDMETLTVTVQMTTSEVRSAFKPYLDAGYQSNGSIVTAPIEYLTWDGGEYAVTPWMIFRVVERSCNP